MTKPDGGAAFPRPYGTDEHDKVCNSNFEQQGMTLRQYYAGQALVGLIGECFPPEAGLSWGLIKAITSKAYEFADAMIAEG